MNVIKVTLGFLELAFALKFLSVADLAYGWRILDRETFLALWIVIFGLMGLYLLEKIKFPHDGDENRDRRGALLSCACFFSICCIYDSRTLGGTFESCQCICSSCDDTGL